MKTSRQQQESRGDGLIRIKKINYTDNKCQHILNCILGYKNGSTFYKSYVFVIQ